MSNYPGQTEAEKLGYNLYGFVGDKSSATYTKAGLLLKVYKDVNDKLKASLWSSIGVVEIEIKDFAFPHSNFHIFERDIRVITQAGEIAHKNMRAAKLADQF